MYLKNEDTICAPATVPGTGAISVIRVSGPEALAVADKVVKCGKHLHSETSDSRIAYINSDSSDNSLAYSGTTENNRTDMVPEIHHAGPIASAGGYTLKFGTVSGADGKPLDEVLVSVFKAPRSYTGENSVEISCHASSYIVNSMMELLLAAGARLAEPGEFTLRAYLNGKMDLSQAEAVADLISSQSAAAHRVAFNQMKGGFSSELKDMRSQLLNIVSLMELELDFSEEEVEFADRSELNVLLDRVLTHIGRLIESFRLGNAIKNGIPVAIVGATNAGKSTLLNTLLGEERAIVSDIHGTTRDTIEETLNIDGVLFRFIDTAGIRETDEAVERIGIERTFKKLGEADIVLGMLDGTKSSSDLRADLNAILSRIDLENQQAILLLNKSDVWIVRDDIASGNGYEQKTGTEIKTSSPEDMANKNVFMINKLVSLIEKQSNEVNLRIQCDNHAFTPYGNLRQDFPTLRHPAHDTESPSDSNCSSVSSIPHATKTDKHVIDVKQEEMEQSMNAQQYGRITTIAISAKTGTGIDELRHALSAYSRDRLGDSDTTLVTNTRHLQALTDARTSLLRVRTGLASSLPTDLVSQDLREALYHLGSILGEISTDEVLGNIFRNFCIGK